MKSTSPVFHALFQGEKYSDMIAHFGAAEEIKCDNSVHITEFEHRLITSSGYKTIGEAEQHLAEVFKDDETKNFAALFQDGKLLKLYERNHVL